MTELKQDETNRILGRKRHTCRICGAEGDFETYLAREMMQGTKEEFVYFACDRCHCLQIASVPENLGEYYGSDYYSYQLPENPEMKFDTPVTNTLKVLDVGCGAGEWLRQKALQGWGNLYGCDPFLPHDRRYGERVYIRKCSIHEMEGDGTFDIIRMSDSFEHMTDPAEVLQSACRLLKQGGTLYMTIPTYPNIAFERYGPHWYQLDAPRHIFLHSKESIRRLAEAAGFAIAGIRYDANDSQIIRSFFYQQGVPFFEQQKLIEQYFNGEELERLERDVEIWNERECGDHMEIYLQKSTDSAQKNQKKVIFQKFSGKENGVRFPYPPLYREPDTDYICFTDCEEVYSSHWRIQRVARLEQEELKPYLEQYALRWELKANQIQMGPLSMDLERENVLTVPAAENLPFIRFEESRFISTADGEGNYVYRLNPVYQGGRYEGRELLLTVGVPVSNQIDTIERCLSHIKPLLDGLDAELLVIDTGSTDGTVEVCRRYGARVVSHPWCDNMSVVRNEGIYHAKGLWYMSIDDDEWFEDVEDILAFFRQGTYKEYDTAGYIQRNYADMQGQLYEDACCVRMAKITPQLHFEGRIHDMLQVPERNRGYLFKSYVHHYGFVNDRPEKVKAKFMRNASALLYDIYEYPLNLRYRLQLANEYKCIEDYDTTAKLCAQLAALTLEAEEKKFGKDAVAGLMLSLYDKQDGRLYSWAEYLNTLFPMTAAEQGGIAWCLLNMAYREGLTAHRVFAYYTRYEQWLERHRRNPDIGRKSAFYGLEMVEHEFYIMDAEAIGYCAAAKIGEEEKACEILRRFPLEGAERRLYPMLIDGLAGGDRVYGELCRKLTAMQWEEWSGMILDAFALSLNRDSVWERQLRRLPEILSRISVSAVITWVERSKEKRTGKIEERLYEYAMTGIGEEDCLQVYCLCAWLLKEAYVAHRKEEKGRVILYHYIAVTGVFAEQYYHPNQLTEETSCVISPDIRAVWRMAVALADGRANSTNVAMLKQALQIFPLFHEEIRSVLTELS